MTDTGDREGCRARAPIRRRRSSSRGSTALRGEIELPVPAASAVKVGGERAYKLHRRGVAVEMPVRRSQVARSTSSRYRDGVARLDLRVSSGTYVRAIATALGGHCTTLRRTEVGPFGSRRPTRSAC